jgi:hypothetical protein
MLFLSSAGIASRIWKNLCYRSVTLLKRTDISLANLQTNISKCKTDLPNVAGVAPTVPTRPMEDMTCNQGDEQAERQAHIKERRDFRLAL